MKKKYWLPMVFVLFNAASIFGQSKDAGTEVMELSRRKFRWLTTPNLDSLKAVLDDRLKFVHSNGWIQTKDDVIADRKSEKLIYQTVAIKQMDVRLYESMAIVIGEGEFSG